MPDLRERLDRKAARFEARPEALSRVRERAGRRTRRRRLGTMLLVMALVAGGGWVAFDAFRPAPRPAPRPVDEPDRPTPVRPEVAERFRLPEAGGEVVVTDDGAVWGVGERALWRFDTATEEVQRFPQPPPPRGGVVPLQFAEGRLWGAQLQTGTIFEIRLNGRLRSVARLGAGTDFLVRRGWIWIVDGGRLRRFRFDGSSAGSVGVPADAYLAAELEGPGVWVREDGGDWIGDRGGDLIQIDPDSLAVLRRIDVPQDRGLEDLAADERGVWFADWDTDGLARLGERYESALSVRGMAVVDAVIAQGWLWALGSEQEAGPILLWQVDPRQGEIVGDPIPVKGRPNEIQVAGGSLWVAHYSRRPRLTRIDLVPSSGSETPQAGAVGLDG